MESNLIWLQSAADSAHSGTKRVIISLSPLKIESIPLRYSVHVVTIILVCNTTILDGFQILVAEQVLIPTKTGQFLRKNVNRK